MVPPDPGPGHTVPPLGYARLLAFHICLIPALSQIPCKYRAVQHHLQGLRLHQPAFTHNPLAPQVHRGGGVQTMTMPRGGGGGGATLEHIYHNYHVYIVYLYTNENENIYIYHNYHVSYTVYHMPIGLLSRRGHQGALILSDLILQVIQTAGRLAEGPAPRGRRLVATKSGSEV